MYASLTLSALFAPTLHYPLRCRAVHGAQTAAPWGAAVRTFWETTGEPRNAPVFGDSAGDPCMITKLRYFHANSYTLSLKLT